MIHAIKELSSHKAPAGRPMPIAFHDGTLWVGCWDTARLYAIDPKTWTVREEVELPAKPYGIAALDGALRVVIGIGEADDRYIYRFVPGSKLGEEGRIACPDFTGSHLTTDGKALYLVQQTHGKVVELDAAGAVKSSIALPTRCAGLAYDGKTWHMISADDEFDVLEFGTLDIASETPAFASIAPMNPEARGLAFDGSAWWTSHREENDVVSFAT